MGLGDSSANPYEVNMSFPKGEKFAQWLKAVAASTTLGEIKLNGVRASATAVGSQAVTWISSQNMPKYFSFNTPLSAKAEEQCGRAVFSDVHITDDGGPKEIDKCVIGPGALNAQQKALEFLFFDLSSCVQNDKLPPSAPK